MQDSLANKVYNYTSFQTTKDVVDYFILNFTCCEIDSNSLSQFRADLEYLDRSSRVIEEPCDFCEYLLSLSDSELIERVSEAFIS